MTLLPASQAFLRLVNVLEILDSITSREIRLFEIRSKGKLTEGQVGKLGPSAKKLDEWCAAGAPHEGKKPRRTFDGMELADWVFGQKPPLPDVGASDDAFLIRTSLSNLSAALNQASLTDESTLLVCQVPCVELPSMAGENGRCWHELAYLLAKSRFWAWLKAIDEELWAETSYEVLRPDRAGKPFEFPALPVERAIREWERFVPELRKQLQPINAGKLRAAVLREATLATITAAGVLAKTTLAANLPPPAPALHSGGRLQIGDEFFCLDEQEEAVLVYLVDHHAAQISELRRGANVDQPDRVLKTLREKYPKLEPYIRLAVKKGKGGYGTTIRRA
ncbi:MAG: hypothetical protein ACYC35_28330 [Pirellulales bacterium]